MTLFQKRLKTLSDAALIEKLRVVKRKIANVDERYCAPGGLTDKDLSSLEALGRVKRDVTGEMLNRISIPLEVVCGRG